MRKEFNLDSLREFFECTRDEFMSVLGCTEEDYTKLEKLGNVSLSTILMVIVRILSTHDRMSTLQLMCTPVMVSLMWNYLGYKIDIDVKQDQVKITFPFLVKRDIGVTDNPSEPYKDVRLIATDHMIIKGICNFYSFSNQVISKIIDSAKVDSYDSITCLVNLSINNKYFN